MASTLLASLPCVEGSRKRVAGWRLAESSSASFLALYIHLNTIRFTMLAAKVISRHFVKAQPAVARFAKSMSTIKYTQSHEYIRVIELFSSIFPNSF